ncbi:terpene synthase family protein [Micromonospora sp. NPDC049559]|uniref:terpene synthase family protein n=1 Tax=Micromonospora sp. NPDC049559 TaxID=3155923 RepID=UPI00342228E1
MHPTTSLDPMLSAAAHGRICATAATTQRGLSALAGRYPELFPAPPFDPTLLHSLALATAFLSPDMSTDRLGVASRSGLLVFALDWQFDHVAKTAAEVEELAAACLLVAQGGEPQPGDPVAPFLASLRDELAAAPAFASTRHLWLTELRLMLAAMTQEWYWRPANSGEAAPPSLDTYLDNAASAGSSLINVAHWIVGAEPGEFDEPADLVDASRSVQRALRLLNDLATYERDLRSGDVNALRVAGRDEVMARLDEVTEESRDRLRRLTDRFPEQADYLNRQLGFTGGFYRVGDFWDSK